MNIRLNSTSDSTYTPVLGTKLFWLALGLNLSIGYYQLPSGDVYISALTTDIEEVLLDDTTDFYLTWE